MKGFTKRTVAVILALCLAILPILSAAALPIEEKYPIVYVPGLNTSNILLNPGSENEEVVFPPSGDALTQAIKGAVPVLAKLALTRDWDAFCDALVPLLNDLFEDFACNTDGTSKENVGIDWEYDAPERIIEKNETTFHYDWRLDPMDISNDLSDYIDYVLDVTHSDHVAIVCHSMGGIITLSYFAQHGYDKVKSVLYDTTAIYGTSTCGRPLMGDISFEGKAICGFVNDLLMYNDNADFLTTLMDIFYKTGVFDGVANIADTLVENIAARIYNECLVGMFGTMPGLWSLTPLECYEPAKANCFDGSGDTYAELIKKIDVYHNTVRLQREALIEDSLEYMNIGIFSRYNFYATPVISNWNVQSDSVVDTTYSSMGATCAPVKETLTDDYIASRNAAGFSKYISADKVIDASTCLYPDYTWIIKDFSHSWGCGELNDLENAILFSDEQITVNTFEEYPQFMVYYDPDDSIRPLTSDDITQEDSRTLFEMFIDLFRFAFNMIINSITSKFTK